MEDWVVNTSRRNFMYALFGAGIIQVETYDSNFPNSSIHFWWQEG